MKHLYPTTPATQTTLTSRVSVKQLVAFSLLLTSVSRVNAQAVSGIVTDYNSFWKTSALSINTVKPVNSHNLLAFTYNTVQYSTGVNDQALTSHGENFVAGDFWSLPVSGFTGAITSNTKIGVGEMYDGVHNGASNPAPLNNIAYYLTDGIKGLNIGTGVANLPAGTISFLVNTIKPSNIGDGIPDIVVTQIADPSGSTDSYSFVDASGNIIGHKKDMYFQSIPPVGNWTADFYEAATNPLTLTGGFTNTDREIRVWAADLSDFGITAANYQSVLKFNIKLSGNSDVAFVSYNNATFNISSVLPVTLAEFAGKEVNSKTKLNWRTESEENTNHFTIERSADNGSFASLMDISSTGNSTSTKNYTVTDEHPLTGTNYYRLKMVDKDGSFTYSKVISVKIAGEFKSASIFPNPTVDNVIMTHPQTLSGKITVYNAGGIAVMHQACADHQNQTTLQVRGLVAGIYFIVWENGSEKISLQLVKK